MTRPPRTPRPVPEAAIAAVQRRGSHKRDLVRSVLQEAVARGQLLSKAEVHRRAGVSRDLVDAMQAEYDEAMAKIKQGLTGTAHAAAEVTSASLRAQLEHYRQLHRRAEQRTEALERRLGVILGHELTADVHSPAAAMVLADQSLQRRISELESEVGQLSNQLSSAQAELTRVRKVNTQLMRQKNSRPA